jgi:hypothetical protein
MKALSADFNSSMKSFRRERAFVYEEKLNVKRDAASVKEAAEKLYCALEGALSGENRHLLYEYTDRIIALYNNDPDYYYDRGFDDCERFYEKLFKIAPVCRVGDYAADGAAKREAGSEEQIESVEK